MKTLPDHRNGPPATTPALARTIVDEAIRRYFRKRRSRVPAFVDSTYALLPAMKLHARAIGHDLWRAPLNAALTAPQLGISLAARILRRAGRNGTADWMVSRQLFLKTEVTREIERRLYAELLELPHETGSLSDALAEEILSDARLPAAIGMLEGSWGAAEQLRLKALLSQNVVRYLNNRAAVDEIVNTALTAWLGLVLARSTPSMFGLGSLVPLLVLNAATAAFSGAVTDPVQRALGLHHHRLIQFLDALETDFLGLSEKPAIGTHYAARIVAAIEGFAQALSRAAPERMR